MSLSQKKKLPVILRPLLIHSISLRNFSTTRYSTAIDDFDTAIDDASKTKSNAGNSDALKMMSDADNSDYSEKRKRNASKSHSAFQHRCLRNSTPHCTSIFTSSITVECYPSISTSQTSYSDFLLTPRDFNFFTRSYARFPKMLSVPERSKDAMDQTQLKLHIDPKEFTEIPARVAHGLRDRYVPKHLRPNNPLASQP